MVKSIDDHEKQFDLIVIGGGIHGLIAGLLAAENGRRTLLLEKGRIGEAATGGWFGILHGGLRYLQTLDVRRFRSSLVDSRWFLTRFPDLVAQQPFLMPLYGHDLKRPAVFRAAFAIERILGFDRNWHVPQSSKVARGRVLSVAEVRRHFPGVKRVGLQGGALWEELVILDRQGLICALRAQTAVAGLALREDTEVTGLQIKNGQVFGVMTKEGGYLAPAVVNATGAWSTKLAHRFDPKTPPLGHPALAFNILLDRPAPTEVGLSLTQSTKDGRGMIFLYRSRCGRVFAGTDYLPFYDHPDRVIVPEAALAAFLGRLAEVVPSLEASVHDIVEVTSGLLPAAEPGSVHLRDSDMIYDHGRNGGPAGLVSLWGVKYTTAPSVARRVLAKLLS
ncbi:MAG: FAD-dependent oxidoreductase [Pseudomonadota bacterium]